MNSRYTVKDIQWYIDKLVSWYVVKFSDLYLDNLQSNVKRIDSTLLKIMNYEALQKRYTTFEKELFLNQDSTDGKVILQKRLVVAAGWGLIYYKKTSPEYGFYRATQLLQDFNSFFGWNLSPKIYKTVFDRNYSLDNPEIVQLLNKKKKQKREKKENDTPKGKSVLFNFFVKKRIRKCT